MDKAKAIVKSVRFHQLVIVAVLAILVESGAVSGDNVEIVIKAIQGVLGASVLIGSADSVASKWGK